MTSSRPPSTTSASASPSPAAARLSGGISGPPGSVLMNQAKNSSIRPSSADFITMLNSSATGGNASTLSPSAGPGPHASGIASASVLGGNKIINGPRPSSEILTGATGANLGAQSRLAPAINTTYAQEVEAIDRWFGEVEHTLEDMASTKVDDNFKEELSAIEQWFKVLSDVERTMALYSLFHHISHVQIRFFTTVLTQMARRDPTFGFLTPGSEKGESRPSSIVGEGAQDDSQSEFAQKLLSLIPQRLASAGARGIGGQTRSRLFDRTSMSSIDRSSISSIGDLQDGMNRTEVNADGHPIDGYTGSGLSVPVSAVALNRSLLAVGSNLSPRTFSESELLNHPATRGQKRSSGGGHPLQEGSIPSPGSSAPFLQKRTSTGGLPSIHDGGSPVGPMGSMGGSGSLDNLTSGQRSAAMQYDSMMRSGRVMSHRQGSHLFTNSPQQATQPTSLSAGSRSQPTSPNPTHGLAQALSAGPHRRAVSPQGRGNSSNRSKSPLNLSPPNSGNAFYYPDVTALLAPAGMNGGSGQPGDFMGANPRSPRSPRSPKPRTPVIGSNNSTPTGLYANHNMNGSGGPRGARSPSGGSSPFPQPEHGKHLYQSYMQHQGKLMGADDSIGSGFGSPYAKDKGKIPDVVPLSLLEDIPAWLRTLRLHKYTPIFETMSWKDMIQLDGDALEKLGVSALGARTKFLKVFEQVQAQVEAEKEGKTATVAH